MDVEAYLERIRYRQASNPSTQRPTIDLLRSLHRAHLFTVPFENLDIHIGRTITCDEPRILHKIINERRGGFCYELNGAFAALLRELGFSVTMFSARVARDDGSLGPEFDHLTLRVDLVQPWLADVGFGDSFLEPLPLEDETEQEQAGRIYRVIPQPASSDREFALEVMAKSQWKKQYVFTLQPHVLSDFAGMCHYHQTSPESHFTRQQICSLATSEGRVTLSENKLIETRSGARLESVLAGRDEWRAELKARFGVVLPS